MGIVFRLVPAGSFIMGSPPSEFGRCADEAPHQVTLTKPFYYGKFEVTQDQWEQVTGSNSSLLKDEGEELPVTDVSWGECQMFVKKLCQMEMVYVEPGSLQMGSSRRRPLGLLDRG
jgi:formylglycine-generating enzyme required for sulfatase activity